MDPASGLYTIGAPLFDSITLALPNATRPLVIHAAGASKGKKYVRSVHIDGEPGDSVFISHQRLANGANLTFDMSDTPQRWGI